MNRKLSVLVFSVDILLMLIFIFSRWHVVMSMQGQEELTVQYGQAYVDPGVHARFVGRDVAVLDREVPVKTEGEVNTMALGDYTVEYSASRLLHHAKAHRTVHVVDETPPELLLLETKTLLDAGESWNDSFTAQDNVDGDLTASVQISGRVDTQTAGTYDLTYTVTDNSGNTATAARTVVVDGVAEPVTGEKIVFLTFDDGPGEYTDELLDILDRHNAKATFFVTAGYPDYQYCIGKEYQAGHAIGVHCFTHDYSRVYASQQAFWDDFDRMNEIIASEIGHTVRIFRFPGGSSNTVSRGVPGLMTQLASDAHAKGYEYYDWNVDSNDAGGTTTSDGVYENVIAGLSRTDISVVLCHDTHSWTVGAIDRILTWGEENGYTFLPLQKGAVIAHHTIVN